MRARFVYGICGDKVPIYSACENLGYIKLIKTW